MFIRKYWLPISVFIMAIAGIGLYLLTTQPPKEPIVIYKPVEPIEKPTQQPKETEVAEGDTSQGGHVHADGTWHEGPHKEETVQVSLSQDPEDAIERSPAYLQERERLLAENAKLKRRVAEIKAFEAEFKTAEAVFLELKTGIANFSDVLDITRQKFSKMSEAEQREFLNRAGEFEKFRIDISDKILALPSWVHDEIEKQEPGILAIFAIPPIEGQLPYLQAERLGVPHLGIGGTK